MKTYYKILKISSDELKHDTGNVTVNGIVPFGLPFKSKDGAKKWLKANSDPLTEYIITRFYALALPETLLKIRKKNAK